MCLWQKIGPDLVMKKTCKCKGVSLLEVIVAVLIFSVAIVPLYYALTYGARQEIDYSKVTLANKILESFRDEVLSLDFETVQGLVGVSAGSTSWQKFDASALPPNSFDKVLKAQREHQDFQFSGQVRTPPDAVVDALEFRAEVTWPSHGGPVREPENVVFVKVRR